jgi:hypothetical protein
MPVKGVIVLVLLTIAMAIPTWIVSRGPPPVVVPTKLFSSVDPMKADALAISHSSGKTLSIDRVDPASDRWMLTWKEGSQSQRWPASAPRVRGVLRLLSGLMIGTAPDRAADRSSSIVITVAGSTVKASLDESLVSGRAALRLDDNSVALIDSGLHSVLTTPDPAVWRDLPAFASPILDASRVTIAASGQELALARVGKQWAIVKPIAEPAERAKVEELLKSLATIQAQRFVSDTTTDWSKPTASVRVEIDERTPSGDDVTRSTLIQDLLIAGEADIGGTTILARAAATMVSGETRSALWGPAALVLSRQAFDSLSTDPASVISRSPAPGARADVARIKLVAADTIGAKPVEFLRTLSGWSRDNTPVSGDDDAAIESLLSLMFETRADWVKSGPGQPGTSIATLTLAREDGSPMATLDLSQVAQGSNAGFVASRDVFHWTFATQSAGKRVFAWVAARCSDAP